MNTAVSMSPGETSNRISRTIWLPAKMLPLASRGQLDVQVGIAVDDVVAAAALDEVAAVAAEHDVAVGERHRAFGEEVGKAKDEVDVDELVEGIDEGSGARQGLPDVGAAEHVIEGGAADGLGLDPEVAHGVAGRGQLVGDELAPGHVDADAVRLVLERAPVEAEQTGELVEAAQAQHDVVAREADHLVALGAAVQHVVAGSTSGT